MSRLVVISNRVADPRKSAASSLTAALGQTLAADGGLWFGWSGTIVEDGQPGEGQMHSHQAGKVRLNTVDLCREDHDSYYLGYGNAVLWPVLHGRLDMADFEANHLDGYRRVNQLLARKLLPLLRTDDILWVHNYQLIPMAAELRAMGCRNRIGFFLHTPLPPAQILAALPQHAWLMRCLFAYDLVGFQSRADLANFAHYAGHEAGAEVLDAQQFRAFGRRIQARVFPFGIDVQEFSALSQSQEASDTYARIKLQYAQRRLLLGVERLDYSRGLPQRLKAFHQLLKKYPENLQRTTLLQIASPSHKAPDATHLRQKLDALCDAINGDFGDLDWMPVRYIHRNVSRKRLPGLYRAAAVALVTPLCDGVSLMAKEFIIAQDPADPGVLVLSRFTGAAEQLEEAMLVNPYDTAGMADSLQQALQMPLIERQRRHRLLLARIRSQDVHWWRQAFLSALADCVQQ